MRMGTLSPILTTLARSLPAMTRTQRSGLIAGGISGLALTVALCIPRAEAQRDREAVAWEYKVANAASSRFATQMTFIRF